MTAREPCRGGVLHAQIFRHHRSFAWRRSDAQDLRRGRVGWTVAPKAATAVIITASRIRRRGTAASRRANSLYPLHQISLSMTFSFVILLRYPTTQDLSQPAADPQRNRAAALPPLRRVACNLLIGSRSHVASDGTMVRAMILSQACRLHRITAQQFSVTRNPVSNISQKNQQRGKRRGRCRWIIAHTRLRARIK